MKAQVFIRRAKINEAAKILSDPKAGDGMVFEGEVIEEPTSRPLSIVTAVGKQLDDMARVLGVEPRRLEDDESLRHRVVAKIRAETELVWPNLSKT